MNADVLRLFLALPLSAFYNEIKDCLALLKRDLRGIRWVPFEQVHLTLHFFGDTFANEVGKIIDGIHQVVCHVSSLDLRLTDIGGFPNLEHPNVLWVGAEDRRGGLALLEESIRVKLREIGFPVETRPFRAHATFGRAKVVPHGLGVEQLVSKLKLPLPTCFRIIDRLVLYKSELRNSGAVHETIKEFPFGETS